MQSQTMGPPPVKHAIVKHMGPYKTDSNFEVKASREQYWLARIYRFLAPCFYILIQGRANSRYSRPVLSRLVLYTVIRGQADHDQIFVPSRQRMLCIQQNTNSTWLNCRANVAGGNALLPTTRRKVIAVSENKTLQYSADMANFGAHD